MSDNVVDIFSKKTFKALAKEQEIPIPRDTVDSLGQFFGKVTEAQGKHLEDSRTSLAAKYARIGAMIEEHKQEYTVFMQDVQDAIESLGITKEQAMELTNGDKIFLVADDCSVWLIDEKDIPAFHALRSANNNTSEQQ